ncbi:leucine rich repeat virulence protein [Salmonella enterica subsp. arizonae]|nr:leucine rich repeat virulence protein [Salmonella enterica subsp. arizonae]
MLDLAGLNLRTLPVLPECVSTLNVSNNHLSALPNLPKD